MAGESQRGGVPVRGEHSITVQQDEQYKFDLQGTPVGHVRVQEDIFKETGDSMVGAELLLQVWECGVDFGD